MLKKTVFLTASLLRGPILVFIYCATWWSNLELKCHNGIGVLLFEVKIFKAASYIHNKCSTELARGLGPSLTLLIKLKVT